MPRTLRALWAGACALAVVTTGCQDYNFNPVGRCLIQPGTRRVTLSSVASADVLFVVDDSGSMASEQAKLASNFSVFINNLDQTNVARADAGLEPFDFHIAVTPTSVFYNYQTDQKPAGPYTCSDACGAATGRRVCCGIGGAPAKQPRACPSGAECAGLPGNTTCGTNCPGLKGEKYCCNQTTGAFESGSVIDEIPCSRVATGGEAALECGTFQRHYAFADNPGCTAGVAVDQWPFPAGEFVSYASGSAANPRVLHFDKELYTGTANQQGFTRAQLISFFGGNATVGTCGSFEEQPLQAARRALELAAAGQQKDTYARTGSPALQTWTPRTATGGGGVAGSPADWLGQKPNSKLVLVFVGDEDDCSAPADPSGGVVLLAETGTDACQRDASTPPNLGGKQYAVAGFADYFTGLGRPVGAAFIFPASLNSCSGDTCVPGMCCGDSSVDPTACVPSGTSCVRTFTCGAQAPGTRLFQTASELRNLGADVLLGSICDPDFGQILNDIAELVKPPSGLELPSLPAADEVTLLRIADSDGNTRKVCVGPLPPRAPTNYTLQEAQATGVDWWFTVDKNPAPPTSGVTKFVYINPSAGCIANPGETYSADYIGKLPEGGCGDDQASRGPGHADISGDEMCSRLLGGAAGSWTCYAGLNAAADACVATTGIWNDGLNPSGTGSCICGPRTDNCPTP